MSDATATDDPTVPRYALRPAQPGDTDVNADKVRANLLSLAPNRRVEVGGTMAVLALKRYLPDLTAALRTRLAERCAEEATARGVAVLADAERDAFVQEWLNHAACLWMLVTHPLCQFLTEPEMEHYRAEAARIQKAAPLDNPLTRPLFFTRAHLTDEILARFDPYGRGVAQYQVLVDAVREPTPPGALCVAFGFTDNADYTVTRAWVLDALSETPTLAPLYTNAEDPDLLRVIAW